MKDMTRAQAVAGIVGSTVIAVGGLITQVVQSNTTIDAHQLSYPWTPTAMVAIELVWVIGQLMIVIGLLGVRRNRAAGVTPNAVRGMSLAVLGAAGVAICEVALIAFRTQRNDDPGPLTVEALFGLCSIAMAVGLLLAGHASMRSGEWTGWRRFTIFVAGIWGVALIGLQLTPALPIAVAIYGLSMLAICIASVEPLAHSDVVRPAPRSSPLRAETLGELT